jgi:Na+-driven multidrug efflux pump
LPVFLVYYLIDIVLIKAGFDEVVAGEVRNYLLMMIPGIICASYKDAMDVFLIAMGYSSAIMVVDFVISPFYLALCYWFVSFNNLGTFGLALTLNITSFAGVISISIYALS